MKATLSVATILLSCLVSFPAASQTVTSIDPEEARILSLEAAWNRAEQQKDTQALDLLLSDSLSYTDYDGTFMDKAEFLESARKSSLHPAQITDQSIKAHIYGQSAVVTGLYVEMGTDKAKPYQRRGRFTDTWIRRGNSWQCVASQSTLIAR
jgi:ketosteroid isomerase-like protein